MNFNTVLDISSIIWDKTDFEVNMDKYYKLVNGISTLFDKLEKENPKILLRNELLDEMINDFPFDSLPNHFYDFGKVVYSFLGNVGSNMITYSDQIISDIVSIPDLIKAHYNDTTKNEVNYLIAKIHTDSESQNVYFTFEYLWNGVDKLKTEVGEDAKEYETIISDNENELEDFFTKFKSIFEHNHRHDKTIYNTKEKWEEAEDRDGFVSRLSCYNEEDDVITQELLDNGLKSGECYYNYDSINEVWVVFRCHLDNKYHGYDENNPEKIPNKVRKHFNK